MTEKEALERCNRLINGFSVNNSITEAFKEGEKGYPTFAKMKEFAEECKSALEKQIAKKPELIEGKMWTCPCCDNNLMHKRLKYPTELMPLSEGLPYCLSCGQKIDWGNEDAE